jgi:hypothetical protein
MQYKTDIYNVRRLSDEAKRVIDNLIFLHQHADPDERDIIAKSVNDVVHQFCLYLEEDPNE